MLTPGTEPFAGELRDILPADLPYRENLVRGCAEHLALVAEANLNFNLTRISTPREAAIKHVLDSVTPWRLFAGARHVIDAGTGAGFPGIPLALVLPGTHFTLAESIQKKARFVESAVDTLALCNAAAVARRAEEMWSEASIDIITARAVAPVERLIGLFSPALKAGVKLLLYKGPDAEQEIADALQKPSGKLHPRAQIVMKYELPEAMGVRTIVEIGL